MVSSPTGGQLAVAIGRDRVIVWDLDRKTIKAQIRDRFDHLCDLAFSPDGKKLACANSSPSRVFLFDVSEANSGLESCFYPLGTPSSICFIRGRKMLACGTEHGAVTWWDLRSGQRLIETAGSGGAILAMACPSDGKYLATGNADTTVLIWSLAQLEEMIGSRNRERVLNQLKMSAMMNRLPPGIWLWNSLPIFFSPEYLIDQKAESRRKPGGNPDKP